MVIRSFGTAGSCDGWIPMARFLTTISMGLSSLVTFGSIFLTLILVASARGVCATSVDSSTLSSSAGGVGFRCAAVGVAGFSSMVTSVISASSSWGVCRWVWRGVCSLIADSVMSASGVPDRDTASCLGSGDNVGCGVGSAGGSSGTSGAIDTRDALLCRARTLLLFGGDFLVGEGGSMVSATPSGGGLKTCDGSIDASVASPTCVFRLLATVRLRLVVSPIVFLRGDARELFGAGVKASSSSSSCCRLTTLFSTSEPSSSSTTTFRRLAARRDGLTGESAISVHQSVVLCGWRSVVNGCNAWCSTVNTRQNNQNARVWVNFKLQRD